MICFVKSKEVTAEEFIPLPDGEHRIQALHALFDRIAAKDAA